ncbi:16S rRNA (guanine(527)-N(7))-methyltransferase RsmG [Acholeplasma granularum]|uniref:16S rRNA (guanine(527)-N(7))-methyltransferase RsmG n=1 Tax=Acholeplasma granularum TaxID=264635 RepID=UPI0004720EFE|nr:16S rRNA (guanine(527)-N(7))-methyltransferase RsmG [Acholeplasma granularum]
MLKNLVNNYLDIELSDKQVKLFDLYYEKLVSYNEHTNLTRITSKFDAQVKHFLDSMYLGRLLDFNKPLNLCDMGAGAGFPSIPLLILYPNLKVTIVESQIKRVQFLKELKQVLELDFNIEHKRAENFALESIEKFDIVTARALGELKLILEFGVPMLKVGGYFIAPKGSKYQEELDDALNAMKVLNIKLIEIDKFELPNDSGFRANLLLKKEKHVSGYPRQFAIIKKKPL